MAELPNTKLYGAMMLPDLSAIFKEQLPIIKSANDKLSYLRQLDAHKLTF